MNTALPVLSTRAEPGAVSSCDVCGPGAHAETFHELVLRGARGLARSSGYLELNSWCVTVARMVVSATHEPKACCEA